MDEEEKYELFNSLWNNIKNYNNMRVTLLDDETKIKNNEGLKEFVLKNLYLIDDEQSTIAHLNTLKNKILQNIEQKIQGFKTEIEKIEFKKIK